MNPISSPLVGVEATVLLSTASDRAFRAGRIDLAAAQILAFRKCGQAVTRKELGDARLFDRSGEGFLLLKDAYEAFAQVHFLRRFGSAIQVSCFGRGCRPDLRGE